MRIRGDVFLAGRRIHDDERVGLWRPGGRVDIATRHSEIAAETRVSGCHADAADAPSQVTCQPTRMRERRASFLSIRISIVRGLAREISKNAGHASSWTHPALDARGRACRRRHLPAARDRHQRGSARCRRAVPIPPMNPSRSRATPRTSSSTSMATRDCAATSQMRQGDRLITADCLQYDARTQRAKLEGGVEYEDPQLIVQGNSGSYSPALGAAFEGSAVRAAGARCARRGAQHAGGRQRHHHARGRVVHHLPGRRTWPGR